MTEKHRSHTETAQTGYTIVEMTAVITIIALVAVGVVAGSELIDASKQRKVISEVDGIQSAVSTFYAKYHALPGDFKRAGDMFGCNDADAAIDCDGDGNGRIQWGASGGARSEGFRVWQQMSLAEIYSGNYRGGDTGDIPVPGLDIPASAAFNDIHTGFYIDFLSTFFPSLGASGYFPSPGQFLSLASTEIVTDEGEEPVFSTLPQTPVLLAKETQSIDKKMDDGLPMTGKMLAYSVPNGCVIWSGGTPSNRYNPAEEGEPGVSQSTGESTSSNGCALAFTLNVSTL